MKWFLPITLFIILGVGPVAAQDKLLDSLRNDYMGETNDSMKIRKGIFYAYHLSKNDISASIRLLDELKRKAAEKGFASLYPRIAAELGNIYYEKGDYIRSITFSEQSLKEYETAPINRVTWIGKAWAYMWAGLSYSLINDWENAQLNLQASVNASEKAGDTCRLINSSMNLAYIFFDMQAWQLMYQTLKKNQEYLHGCRDYDVSLMTTSSLAFVCAKLRNKGEAEEALTAAEKFLNQDVSRSLEIFYYVAKVELELLKGNGSGALENARKTNEAAERSGDPYYITVATEALGRSIIAAGNKEEGISQLLHSLSLARQNNFLSLQQQTLQKLAAFFEAEGDIPNAYRYNKELLNLKDSIAEKININRRLLLDTRFETEKKESLISQLEADKKIQQLRIRQKNILNYVLIGSAITLLIISLLSYRNYRQKQKLNQQRINELETEKQLMATEAVLKGEEQERTRLAKDLHDGLGGMLSGIKYSLNTMKGNMEMTAENTKIFGRNIDMLNSSIKEMRRVAHNMMPEALVKFGLDTALKDFCNDINQSGALQIRYQSIGLEAAGIDQTTAITIYRIVQELINNTLKHAAARHAIVQVTRTGSVLAVTVEDDGKGFDTSILKVSKGIGWSNIENRVEFLKGKMDVSSHTGKGTSVHIEINA